MNELYTDLLLFLLQKGKLVGTNLYKNSNYPSITIKTQDGEFSVSIEQKDEVKADGN